MSRTKISELEFDVAESNISKENYTINTQDEIGNTAMHRAVTNGDVELVAALIGKGAKINLKNKWGHTSLIIAVNYNYNNIIKLLIQNGAEVDVVDNIHWSPLLLSIDNNNLCAMQLLLLAQANVNAVDEYGQTPIHVAIRKGSIDAIKFILSVEEANVNAKNQYGQTPMHIATENNDIEAVKVLVFTAKVDINIKDKWGNTPLHIATERGNIDNIKTLITNKAVDINTQNEYGKTSLQLATEKGNIEAVKALLNIKGINVNAVDKHGNTALDIATMGDYLDISFILIEKGTNITNRMLDEQLYKKLGIEELIKLAFVIHTLFAKDIKKEYYKNTCSLQDHLKQTFNFQYNSVKEHNEDEEYLKSKQKFYQHCIVSKNLFKNLFINNMTKSIKQGPAAVHKLLKLIHDNADHNKLFDIIISDHGLNITLAEKIISNSKLETLISYNEFEKSVIVLSLKTTILLTLVMNDKIKITQKQQLMLPNELLARLNKMLDLVYECGITTTDLKQQKNLKFNEIIKKENADLNDYSIEVTGEDRETEYSEETGEYHNNYSINTTGEAGYSEETNEYHNDYSINITGENGYLT